VTLHRSLLLPVVTAEQRNGKMGIGYYPDFKLGGVGRTKLVEYGLWIMQAVRCLRSYS
jgi:hypothetical protein